MSVPQQAEIRIEGKTYHVPSTSVAGRPLIVKGARLKIASVQDEELWDGEAVGDPSPFLEHLKKTSLGADLFTFAQQPGLPRLPLPHYQEDDNAAAIPLRDYTEWWESLPQESRRNVKVAGKRGVEVRVVPLDADFVRGVVGIYNETAVRQGRPFWHYGKSFETVQHELSTYADRSEYIGAYYQDTLIGFIKLVYANRCAHILHILSRVQHSERRPTNALIAKAVEVATTRQLSYLFYCKYVYGRNDRSPLIDFKRRNGFIHLPYPRFYVPLSAAGTMALALRLHHGATHLLPAWALGIARRVRRMSAELRARPAAAAADVP